MPSSPLPTLRSVEERNALALKHQGLIIWVWNRHRHEYHLRRLGEADAVAAGQLGLLRAAETWDEARDISFLTYAPYWIYQAMQREAWRNMPIQVPAHVLQRGDTASLASLKAAERVSRVVSFSYTPGALPDSRPWEPAVHCDPTAPCLLDGWEKLEDALRFVHPTEREPLLWRYRDGLQLREIGERLGVTTERARQLIERGARRLCQQLGIREFATPLREGSHQKKKAKKARAAR